MWWVDYQPLDGFLTSGWKSNLYGWISNLEIQPESNVAVFGRKEYRIYRYRIEYTFSTSSRFPPDTADSFATGSIGFPSPAFLFHLQTFLAAAHDRRLNLSLVEPEQSLLHLPTKNGLDVKQKLVALSWVAMEIKMHGKLVMPGR